MKWLNFANSYFLKVNLNYNNQQTPVLIVTVTFKYFYSVSITEMYN